MWYANRDFDYKNLKVKKGEPLPINWQGGPLKKYLIETYGDNAVTNKKPKSKAKNKEPCD